jgi:TetR/AcrR family transcriptional regulator, cholesterol catabolism regulator
VHSTVTGLGVSSTGIIRGMGRRPDEETADVSTGQNLGRARTSILDAATRLFGAQGYAGTTMRDIATAVGVLPGSLYTHISGKETLLLEIVETGIDEFLTLHELGSAEGGEPEERLRELIKGHVRIVAANPERTQVVFHQWRYLSGGSLDEVVAKRREYEALFTTLVTAGIDSGAFAAGLDVKVAVFCLLGALNWTPEWYSPTGRDSADDIGDRLAETLLGGLRARP